MLDMVILGTCKREIYRLGWFVDQQGWIKRKEYCIATSTLYYGGSLNNNWRLNGPCVVCFSRPGSKSHNILEPRSRLLWNWTCDTCFSKTIWPLGYSRAQVRDHTRSDFTLCKKHCLAAEINVYVNVVCCQYTCVTKYPLICLHYQVQAHLHMCAEDVCDHMIINNSSVNHKMSHRSSPIYAEGCRKWEQKDTP